MLVVTLSLRKLGNLWKDNFDCSVVYIVKGTSNSSGCVARGGLQSVLTLSAFCPESEIEFRMIFRIRGQHRISRVTFVTERQSFWFEVLYH